MEELLSSVAFSSFHRHAGMDLFACAFTGINLLLVLYSELDHLSRCLDH